MKTKIELTENATMLVDANVQLPNAVKNVLGALIYTRGAFTEHRKENSDWFYKDANSLIEESQVSKKTFFRAINLLEANNFIERKSGSLKKGKNKVTQYKILKGVNILSNDTLEECQKQSNDTLNDTLENANDTLNDTLGEPLMTHKNKELSNKNKELSNKNKEKEIDNNNNKEKNIKKEKEELREKETSIEDSDSSKTLSSSTSNKSSNNTEKTNTDMNTNVERLTKIEERLNNCAKQFKKMIQTIDELQQKVSELEAKQNNTSTNQDSSTSTNETSTKQEISNSKPSNESALPTTHQDEEKPTESNSKASTPIAEDVNVNTEYELFVSKVLDYIQKHKSIGEIKLLEFKNMILLDLGKKNASYKVRKDVENKIDDLIQEFYKQSDLSHPNEQSSIVAHQNDEKPTESVSKASTAISEDNAATSNDVDDLFDVLIISEKASKKDELKHSNEGTDCTPVQSEDTKKDDSKEDSKEVKDLKMPKTVEGCFQRFLESVEDLINPTKTDLDFRKDCIIKSCKIEEFEEFFIQELEAKIDEHIKEYSEKSNSKPSNGSNLPTTHQDEEKSTEAQQMPLNEKKLRYLDTSTDKQYATEAEAQKDGVNPWFLYDWKVGRCIAEYTSPSNEGSGIVANQDDLKPVEAQQMPSTSMSYSYAAAY